MSRSGFSAAFLQYMYASNTPESLALLIQIHHPNLSADLCYVNKATAVNGNTVNPLTGAVVTGGIYQAKGFTCALPAELTASLPTMMLTFDNTDRLAGYTFEATAGGGIKPDIYLTGVLMSDTLTPQFGPYRFKAGPVTFNSKNVEVTLAYEDTLSEMFPVPGMTPYGYPALYGNIAT